jgi:hypothetical protein
MKGWKAEAPKPLPIAPTAGPMPVNHSLAVIRMSRVEDRRGAVAALRGAGSVFRPRSSNRTC